MPNRASVFTGHEIVTIEAELVVTPKGFRVKERKVKVPSKPVRAGRKKHNWMQIKEGASSGLGGSPPEALDYWQDDPQSYLFDPESESTFTKPTKVCSQAYAFLPKVIFLSTRPNMIIWMSGCPDDSFICSH